MEDAGDKVAESKLHKSLFFESMQPSVYLIAIISPVLYTLVNSMIEIQIPHKLSFFIGYLPALGSFAFVFHAYFLLEKSKLVKKPKLIILYLVPFINWIYQFYVLFPLGKKLVSLNVKCNSENKKFNGNLPMICCLLFLLLNILVQIRIQYQISNVHTPYNIKLIEWLLRGGWIYASSIMFWDYSKIINNIIKNHNKANAADAKSRAAD